MRLDTFHLGKLLAEGFLESTYRRHEGSASIGHPAKRDRPTALELEVSIPPRRTVPNLLFVMGSIPRDRQGVAGALSQMTRMVGVVAQESPLRPCCSTPDAAPTSLTSRCRPTDPTAFMAAYRDTFAAVAALSAVSIAVSLLRPARGPHRRYLTRPTRFPTDTSRAAVLRQLLESGSRGSSPRDGERQAHGHRT